VFLKGQMDRSVRLQGLYAFGPFVLDPARRVLMRNAEPVALTPTVFDTLLHLVDNFGRVVTKEELLDAVWPRRLVEESNVTQTIFTLRKALGCGGDTTRYVITAPGRGYRFAEPVRFEAGGALAPFDALDVKPSPAPTPPAPRSRRAGILIGAGIAAAALIAAVAVVSPWPWRSPPASAPRALVVLADFQNQTGEPIFDRTLAKATEIDLDQSPVVTVLTQRQVEATLALMTRPADTALTAPLAGEVCARSGGAAVLEGAIAALGARYLITLTATDCEGTRTLAAEKAVVAGREAVVGALDTMTARIRRRLGESARSVGRFNVPLAREKTASLDALKAYSEGVWLGEHGQRMNAVPLLEQAVRLDPKFAMPYVTLSVIYYNSSDFARGAEYITKAYALRDTVDERERYHIVARYTENVTHDTDAVIHTYREWSALYPNDDMALSNLGNAENWIGNYAEAIPFARRAFALNPGKEATYVVLARALMHDGQVAEAAAICARAVSRGLAGDDAWGLITEIDAARGDDAAIARDMAATRGRTSERKVLIHAAEYAWRRGRIAEGDALYERASALSREQGLVDYTLPQRARELVDLGLADRAGSLLGEVAAADHDNSDLIFATAEIGDETLARNLSRAAVKRAPHDTLAIDVFGPQTEAALALRAGRPADAISDLRPAAPFEMRDFDTPYLRGRALLAAGDGARAAIEFRKILDHPTIEPTSPLFPLARLGLARALRLRGDVAGARRAYQAFLTAWKFADPDLPPLIAAKAELARL
jgi:DNA-binding winged helix-turn-helix (wHTH) protein/tetratricopeptide (TPR) repeat protein